MPKRSPSSASQGSTPSTSDRSESGGRSGNQRRGRRRSSGEAAPATAAPAPTWSASLAQGLSDDEDEEGELPKPPKGKGDVEAIDWFDWIETLPDEEPEPASSAAKKGSSTGRGSRRREDRKPRPESKRAKSSPPSPVPPAPVSSGKTRESQPASVAEESSESAAPKKKRSRRRRRGGKSTSAESVVPVSLTEDLPVDAPAAEPTPVAPTAEPVAKRRPDRRGERPSRRHDAPKTIESRVEEQPPVEKPAIEKPAIEKPAERKADDERSSESGEATSRRRGRRRRGSRSREQEVAVESDAAPESDIAPEPDVELEPVASRPEPPKRDRSGARQALPAESGFRELGLSDVMLESLGNAMYIDPTPVQAGFIPPAMQGNDLMGQAQTGTGKTAAFGIPILEMLESGKKRGPQALILVPTRELAVQVRDEVVKLSAGRGARTVAVYGGKPIREQTDKLRRGAEIVVGTPGRVLDHLGRGSLFLGDLRQVVLDEADRMLDIGFRPDIEKILRQCPQSRQTLLLSATLPPPVLRLATRYMRDSKELNFSPKDVAVETIDQYYFTIDPERKFDLLLKLLERETPRQAIVFCRTRRGTEKIHQRLSKKLASVAAIHGDLPQSTRDRVMQRFREAKLQILVATDVVGRGIDVSGISHIINFDIPQFCDDYVHRVGRTGRMGREGVAYTFVSPEEGNELTRIEMRINRLLQRQEMAGFAPVTLSYNAAAPDDPNAPLDAEGNPLPPAPKPVFGRRVHRVRRAL